ncbi:hypothetical protein HDU93_001606 [Gonapodya sp. JEL0774]|nr:hypothetical protein HDU93_001606 [Gonapodya sp. JEL0774]
MKDLELTVIVLDRTMPHPMGGRNLPSGEREKTFLANFWVADETGSVAMSVMGPLGQYIMKGDILKITGATSNLHDKHLKLQPRRGKRSRNSQHREAYREVSSEDEEEETNRASVYKLEVDAFGGPRSIKTEYGETPDPAVYELDGTSSSSNERTPPSLRSSESDSASPIPTAELWPSGQDRVDSMDPSGGASAEEDLTKMTQGVTTMLEPSAIASVSTMTAPYKLGVYLQLAQEQSRKHVLRREPSMFDDISPLPPPSLTNDLIRAYFAQAASTFPIIDRQSFLKNPAANAILLYGVLTVGALHQDSPEARAFARNSLFPRLQRLLKADADRPSLSGFQGCMLAMVYTGANFWLEANDLYRTQAIGTIHALGLYSETYLGNIANTEAQKELCRRCFWIMFFMDRQSVAVRHHPKMISDDGLENLRLPCDSRLWDAPESAHSARHTPTIANFFAATPSFPVGALALEMTLWSLFSRVRDFHNYCWTAQVLPFSPSESVIGTRVRLRAIELEEDLLVWKQRFDMCTMDDCDMTPQDAVYLHTCYLGILALLHGPTQLPGSQAFPTPEVAHTEGVSFLLPPGSGREGLGLWCVSPSFLKSVSAAMNLAELAPRIPRASAIIRKLKDIFLGHLLLNCSLILLVGAHHTTDAGLPSDAGMTLRARDVIRMLPDFISKKQDVGVDLFL